MSRTRFICIPLLAALLVFGCQGSPDPADYPARPISYLVPWNPGGGTDSASRAMASALSNVLGQPANVINRAGGGGVVGHLAIAQANPDGYTVGAMTVEITMMHWTGLTPLTYQDYTPLALLVNNPAAINVRADAPWQTVDELLEHIRANPGSLQASGTSRGGIWDLARMGFLNEAGLPEDAMPWVPSQGAAPALQELIAGGVEVVTCALVEANALRQAGQVRTLAVMSEERLEAFPDVPTLAEQGIDWSIGGWVSIAAPAGLPEIVYERLLNAVEQAANDPAFLDPMRQAGFHIEFISGEDFEEFLETQDQRNGELLRMAGIAS